MLLNFPVGEDSWESSVVSDSVRPYGLYSPPGSSVLGILLAGMLEWVAVGSSRPRDHAGVSSVPCAGRRGLHH